MAEGAILAAGMAVAYGPAEAAATVGALAAAPDRGAWHAGCHRVRRRARSTLAFYAVSCSAVCAGRNTSAADAHRLARRVRPGGDSRHVRCAPTRHVPWAAPYRESGGGHLGRQARRRHRVLRVGHRRLRTVQGPTARRDDPFAPDVLDALRHRTPYLLMDLGRVSAAYRTLRMRYLSTRSTTRSSATPTVAYLRLCTRRAAASRWVVPGTGGAHVDWRQAGRRPVQQPGQAAGARRRRAPRGLLAVRRRRARRAGQARRIAPGSAVYVRLQAPSTASGVPSEGSSASTWRPRTRC